jgi:hypothetical protein
MGVPDFNVLFPPGRDLSPRMAYRVWRLSRALLVEDPVKFRSRLPHVVSLTVVHTGAFWENLHDRLRHFVAHLAAGAHESGVSRCTADDVLLHIILSGVEDGVLDNADEVVCGDANFLQFSEHQIDDCAQAYRALVWNPEIWQMWHIGGDELMDPSWFDTHHVPLWEPVRWFQTRLR